MRSLRFGMMIGLALTLSACSSKKDDTNACGDAQSCAVPWDCPVSYTCDTGCCVVFGCTPDSCTTQGTFCDPDTRACTSVSEKCELSGCECHIANTAAELEASGTPTLTLAGGGAVQVQVTLAATGGLPLPGAAFTYAVDDATRFSVDNSGLLTALTTGTAGTGTLTAHAGTYATCTADLVHLGTVPVDGNVRFFVFDDRTALPVSGATVMIDYGAGDGVANETLVTAASGLAQASAAVPGDGKYTVTVFAAGYNYLSLVGMNATTIRDVALPLSGRKVPQTTAGFTGTPDYSVYEKLVLGGQPKTIKFGMVAGSFLLKSLLNFDLDLFIGSMPTADCKSVDGQGNHPVGCYDLSNSGLPGTDGLFAPLPGGVLLSLANAVIKSHFDSVVQPGRRYAWGLGGEVELADISGLFNIVVPYLKSCDCAVVPDVCEPDCDCDKDCPLKIDFGQVLNSLLPLFSRFASGVKGDLPVKEVRYGPATVTGTWESYITSAYGSRSDPAGNFPLLDTGSPYGQLSVAEPLLSFTDFTVPALPPDPVLSGQAMEGEIVLTGVNSKGYGFVPLGISAGVDCTTTNCLDRANHPEDFNGHVNGATPCLYDDDPSVNGCPPGVPHDPLPNDHIGMFHAKAHGGLQGQEWVTIALALPVSAFFDAVQDGVLRVTGSVVREEPATGASNQLKLAYPGFPTQPATTTGRTYTVTSAADSQIHWVAFATDTIKGTNTDWDGLTTRWNVYFPAEGGTFTAPAVPTLPGNNPKPDPMAPADGSTTISATHIGFRAPGVTLDQLAANSGDSLSGLIDKATGFAVQSRNVTVNP